MSTKNKGGMNRTTAPLTNVSLCEMALTKAMERPGHLPGMICFYGPSGWGKTTAALYVHLVNDAYYIACKDIWVRKSFLVNLLGDMGIPPKKSMWEMVDQVCEQLAKSRRPLIIDEMDKLLSKNAVELIRDIHDGSKATILLIGEEKLPHKLMQWERFHGRILDWVPAQPTDMDDARHLKGLYHPNLDVQDDLLERIVGESSGSARRVVVNLAKAEEIANKRGSGAIGLKEWGDEPFFTGDAPQRSIPCR